MSANKLHPRIDEVSKKKLRAYHLNRPLKNRDGVYNKPVIRLELPAAEVDIKFVDPNTNLELVVRICKDCLISA